MERFVIRNIISGAYIHESQLRIRTFPTRSEAVTYIRDKNLNKKYFEVVRIW